MISSEVQRTLVKSPPELWAELSDPTALARHLGELGEIRITRIDPEQKVEWEAEDSSGTVQIKPSGWGTKVTLTVTREIPTPEPPFEPMPEPPFIPTPEPPFEPTPEPVVEAGPLPAFATTVEESVPLSAEEPEPVVLAEAPLEPEPVLKPRRRLFAQLFRRRHRGEAVEPESPEVIATVEPAMEPASEAVKIAAPVEPQDEETPEELPDISAELKAAEEVAAEQVTAVLTSVLDRLGAAHHRPFSRA
jgi:hypothetical protein